MRQQYHSRKIADKRLIWDVNRLVRLSSTLVVKSVSLSEIKELDKCFWFEGQSSGVTCRQVAEHALLIQKTDLKYPIILSADGTVMDGMHRVAKALIEGRETIDAVKFDKDPDPDFTDVDIDSLPYDDAG
jgi:hypothetical protein